MAQPPNVRRKAPRPLSGDARVADRGLGHLGRWGTGRVGSGPLGSAPSASTDESIEASPPASLGGRSLEHATRWGLTASAIAPESLRARATRVGQDGSLTPPPVAVNLDESTPRRRGVDPEEQGVAHEPALIAPSRRPVWQRWAVVAVACLSLLIGTSLVRRTQEVAVAQGSLVGRLEASTPGGEEAAKPMTFKAEDPAVVSPIASDGKDVASTPPSTHDGHVWLDGGVLHLPNTFKPRDGGYDLVIHFHGDVKIVRESVEVAGINAAVAVINWGISSGPYQNTYKEPGRFEKLLARVEAGLAEKGYRNLELRRLALTAWSGGYGAIESILETRRAPDAENDPLDAVMVFDGIHTGFLDDDKKRLAELGVQSFLRAAKAAANDRILFTMTHSEVDPIAYASTSRCADLLLGSVGRKAEKSTGSAPVHLKLKAAAKSIGRNTTLEPTHDTRVGSFHVLGYRGNTPEAHAAHLHQMAAIALPELAKRWESAAPPRLHPIVGNETDSRKLPPKPIVIPWPSKLRAEGAPTSKTAARNDSSERRARKN